VMRNGRKPRPLLVENFIGRQDILDKLRHVHMDWNPRTSHLPTISVLIGLGGSGKTQIALKLALEYEQR
jgi:hypothetical protein